MQIKQYSQAIERMQQLYCEGPARCIQIRSIKEIDEKIKSKPLNSWKFPRDNVAYLTDKAIRLEQYWHNRKGIDDDFIPCLSPYYGIAEHSAFLGGEVSFSSDTSYHHPILNHSSEWKTLKLDIQNQWIQLMREGYALYNERWSDRFFIKYRGAYGPMDLANMIRGNDLFLDFYDEPDHVNELLSFCVDAIRFYLNVQAEYLPLYQSGIISGFDIWMPTGSVGHLSEDASCLCSLDQYNKFGISWMHHLVAQYHTVLLHLHSMGRKNVASFAEMEKIGLIQISSDPKEPSSVEVLHDNLDILRDKIIIVEATRNDMINNADLFRELKCLLFYHANTISEAREAVSFVRNGFRI